jgi:type II secretory pathway pseudopilin PulG
MILFGREISGPVIRIVAAVIIIVIAILALKLPGWLGNTREARQDRVNTEQSGAAIGAGEEALNTVTNVSAGREATDQVTKQAQDAVRSAPEGQKGAAAIREACRFKSNRNKPECRK